MEFLSYTDVRARFEGLFMVEKEEGDHLRLSLNMPDGATPRVVFASPGEGDEPDDATRSVDRDESELVGCVDGVLHRLHLSEVGMIPVATWRHVLDLAAFELATDERWADFEAEASMHMNGRDALMFRSAEYPILTKIIGAVMENGESRDHAMILFSLDTPFVIEIRPEGGLTVWCANDSIADEVAQVTGAHSAE
jgi:hypothetical protein